MGRVAPRRRNGVETRDSRGHGSRSIGARGTSLVGSSPVPKITEADVAEGIRSSVVPFSAKDLAHATGKSVEAAKAWKSGERTLNSAQLINLARQIPAVRKWLLYELGEAAELGSPEYIDRVVRESLQRHFKT